MSLRHWTVGTVLAFGLLAAAACGDDKKDDDGDSDEEADVGPKTGSLCDTTLTYAKDIQPIMTNYCVRCHAKTVTGAARNNAPTDHNFDTEMGIANEATHADEDSGSGPLSTNTRMPPAMDPLYVSLNLPVPTTAERVTLSKWLACQM